MFALEAVGTEMRAGAPKTAPLLLPPPLPSGDDLIFATGDGAFKLTAAMLSLALLDTGVPTLVRPAPRPFSGEAGLEFSLPALLRGVLVVSIVETESGGLKRSEKVPLPRAREDLLLPLLRRSSPLTPNFVFDVAKGEFRGVVCSRGVLDTSLAREKDGSCGDEGFVLLFA